MRERERGGRGGEEEGGVMQGLDSVIPSSGLYQ